jgi:hypothetical protein
MPAAVETHPLDGPRDVAAKWITEQLDKGVDIWRDCWLRSGRNPWMFVCGVLGVRPYDKDGPQGHNAPAMLEQWQDEFLWGDNFFADAEGKQTNNPRHSIVSGHGVGKGATIAFLSLWFPLTHVDAKAVLTANSQDQLRDNNWPEIRKWAAKLPDMLRAQLQIDEERLYVKAAPELSFLVRRTASKANPEALQGIHAKHVLYLIDEASGIAEVVFEVAQGSLSTDGAIAVMFSNGTRASGFFFDSHHSGRHRWRCRRVNCEDVPRAKSHIAEIIEKYGKGSNKYRVRVSGEFPTKDDDTVIPLEWVEGAKGRLVLPAPFRPIWGLDVARFGDDRCALAKRRANVLVEPLKTWGKTELDVTAGKVVAEWNKTPVEDRPSQINVDVIGLGAGVLVLLRAAGLPAVGVNVAESAAEAEEYFRLRDELWFRGREWFRDGSACIPKMGCEGLASELVSTTYDFSIKGQHVVESKKDQKKRVGRSPDEADAFLLTFYGTPVLMESVLKRRRSAAVERPPGL